jgi:hypothetical protein
MAKIHLVTQYSENYGAHDWSGNGDCPQYWKFKGGEDYFFPLPAGYPLGRVAELVTQDLMPRVEWNSDHSRSHLLNWQVVQDDFRTEFERMQLEYDGQVDFPAITLSVLDLALPQ